MNDNLLEKLILKNILNDRKYDWDKKINSYGTDISILNYADSTIREDTTDRFNAMILYDKKANNFIKREGYKILAKSMNYRELLDELLKNKAINDRILDERALRLRLNMVSVHRNILKICNDDYILKMYFDWGEKDEEQR